jgi:hypothetical protein
MDTEAQKRGDCLQSPHYFEKEYLWRYFACGIVAHVRGFPYAIF